MSTQTLLLIAGMMLVTNLPRALPAAFLEKIRPGARAKRSITKSPRARPAYRWSSQQHAGGRRGW